MRGVNEERFERLVEIMTAMADGDQAAPIMLYTEFGDHVAGAVRRELTHLHHTDITAEDLDGLVIDACLALADCAAAWRPGGGALPWNWAARRIGALASAWVGVYADPYDPAVHDQPADAQVQVLDGDVEDLDVLAGLGHSHPLCALLAEALARVATPRDQALVVGVRVQQSLGDPSPAVTLADQWGLRPEAVRQAVKRATDRLRVLAASDEHYAPLARLPLLGA
jgi:hypothetical protein